MAGSGSPTRRKFSRNQPAFIDVFCGPGRSLVRMRTAPLGAGSLVLLAVWFAIHTVSRETVPVRNLLLSFDAPARINGSPSG